MNTKILILLLMIFCHIVDDYYLQGVLAQMKQKRWWAENYPNPLYKYDYFVALLIHGFSWAFMITLPLTIYTFVTGGKWYSFLFIVNMLMHFMVDDLKANGEKINLIEDQLLHITQIIATWALWLYIL